MVPLATELPKSSPFSLFLTVLFRTTIDTTGTPPTPYYQPEGFVQDFLVGGWVEIATASCMSMRLYKFLLGKGGGFQGHPSLYETLNHK